MAQAHDSVYCPNDETRGEYIGQKALGPYWRFMCPECKVYWDAYLPGRSESYLKQ